MYHGLKHLSCQSGAENQFPQHSTKDDCGWSLGGRKNLVADSCTIILFVGYSPHIGNKNVNDFTMMPNGLFFSA